MPIRKTNFKGIKVKRKPKSTRAIISPKITTKQVETGIVFPKERAMGYFKSLALLNKKYDKLFPRENTRDWSADRHNKYFNERSKHYKVWYKLEKEKLLNTEYQEFRNWGKTSIDDLEGSWIQIQAGAGTRMVKIVYVDNEVVVVDAERPKIKGGVRIYERNDQRVSYFEERGLKRGDKFRLETAGDLWWSDRGMTKSKFRKTHPHIVSKLLEQNIVGEV